LKNVCSNKATIRVKSVKNNEDEKDFDWGSSVFYEPIEECWEVVKFVTNHSKPLACFRDLAKDQSTWEGSQPPNGLELVKFCETRFASKLLMLERYLRLRPVLELLVVNPGYKAWLSQQKADTKIAAEGAKKTIQSTEHWLAVERTHKLLNPVLKLLRLTDGKSGATLGKVYHLMSNLANEYDNEIEGLDNTVRENMWSIFMARWTYFHEPIFTAAYFLDPEFIKGEGSAEEERDFRDVLRIVCAGPHCPFKISDMTTQWASLQTALRVQSHGMNEEEAFSAAAKKMPSFEWARVYLYNWPGIQYVGGRLAALACSASGCEHSWSIEGWIHSKKRNRLSQTCVERLVRTHTNLLLEETLDSWRSEALPWELEMIIQDPDDTNATNATE